MSKYFNLGPKFSKIPIFVSIFGNYLDFSKKKKKKGKFRCWSKFLVNLNFGQDFRKSLFRSKVSKNLDFRQYFRKISIWVKKKFRKCGFRSKFWENLNSGQNF